MLGGGGGGGAKTLLNSDVCVHNSCNYGTENIVIMMQQHLALSWPGMFNMDKNPHSKNKEKTHVKNEQICANSFRCAGSERQLKKFGYHVILV